MIIKLNAGNDNSGNPRRVLVRFNRKGDIVATYDEEYKGLYAVPKRFRSYNGYCEFDTSIAEYKRLVRYGMILLRSAK